MNALQPDLDMLNGYVHGTLDPETSAAVQVWLYSGASSDELLLYEALVREREEARMHLGHATGSPAFAKVTYALHRLRDEVIGDRLATNQRRPEWALLGRAEEDDLTTVVKPNEIVDVELVLAEDGDYAVFAVEATGQVVEMKRGRANAGERVELPGFELSPGEGELVVVALITSRLQDLAELVTAGTLLDQLSVPAAGRRVVHRTYRCMRYAP